MTAPSTNGRYGRASRSFALALAGIAAAAGASVLPYLERSFWRDEVASVSIAERSLPALFDVLGDTDPNMGLYYLVLHAWMAFGGGEPWVRLLSTICACASVAVLALLVKRMSDRLTALIAAAMLALNPFVWHYAQEGRSYALGLLLSTLATYCFLVVWTRPTTRSRSAYAIVSALAVYANFFNAFVVVAHAATVVFAAEPRRRFASLATAFGGVFLAAAPLAVVLATSSRSQISWIEPIGVRALVDFGFAVAGNGALAAAYATLVVLAVRRRTAATGRDAGAPWPAALLVLWLALPPLLLFLASQVTPMFVGRYVIGSVPALAALVAIGLRDVLRRRRGVGLGLCAALATVALAARAEERGERVEDLRAAAAFVSQAAEPGDAVVYAPAFARVGFEWYVQRTAKPVVLADPALARGGCPVCVGDLFAREVSAAAVASRLPSYERVWLIGYPNIAWHPTSEPVIEGGLPVLRRDFTGVGTQAFGQLHARLYVRRSR